MSQSGDGDQPDPRSTESVALSSGDVIELGTYRTSVRITTDDPAYFDVRPYLPPGASVNLVERGGVLYVPHRINEFAIKVVKRKVDLVVFQCLIRYTLGFHRSTCRVSNLFMARWTGLLSPNVRKGLKSLKALGLIQTVTAPTASTAAVYSVPIVRGYLSWRKAREEDAKSGRSSGDSTGLSTEIQRNAVQHSEHSQRKKVKKIGNKTLSPAEALPHKIRSYIDSIRPHQKRVEEEYHLFQLLTDYPESDLVEALDYVQTNGALDTGERVHSPFHYLSYTAEQVIGLIARDKEQSLRREELRMKMEVEQAQQQEKRTGDANELNAALAAFASELTSEQQAVYIQDFKRQSYGAAGMSPPEQVTHKLAAQHWFRCKQ